MKLLPWYHLQLPRVSQVCIMDGFYRLTSLDIFMLLKGNCVAVSIATHLTITIPAPGYSPDPQDVRNTTECKSISFTSSRSHHCEILLFVLSILVQCPLTILSPDRINELQNPFNISARVAFLLSYRAPTFCRAAA